MLAESALCLAHDELPERAGQLTTGGRDGRGADRPADERRASHFECWRRRDDGHARQQATDVANEAFGRHPGHRALHAKGTLLKGTFTATPEAARLTRAAHMQGEPVPVDDPRLERRRQPRRPGLRAGRPRARGQAVPAGRSRGPTSSPRPLRGSRLARPKTFVELLPAQGPGASMAWKFPLFLLRNPSAIAKPAGEPPGAATAGQLRDLHVLRDPRLPLGRCRGHRALRPVHVRARRPGEQHLGPRAAKSPRP